LARKLKLVKCSVCGEVGRIKRNRIVKKLSYPEKVVSVPNISQFDTIVDAWDYAAKICLRMSQRALRKPPSDVEFDNRIAEALYEHFRTMMPHSDEDIRRFESLHRRLIEERLAEHASNINAVVSRMSLSLLYGGIVCTVMSDSFNYPPSTPEELKKQKEAAYMIYTHYRELLIDERVKTTGIGWLNIQLDAVRFGPNAAAKKHTNEIIGGSLTRKQIRAKAPEISMTAQDIIRYDVAFRTLFKKFGWWIRRDPNRSEIMLALFDRFQFQVYDQERRYEYAWVIHDKTLSSSYTSKDGQYFKEGRKTSLYSKNSKSRWCPISPYQSLPIVSIDDTK
jgi:hypothetical protein